MVNPTGGPKGSDFQGKRDPVESKTGNLEGRKVTWLRSALSGVKAFFKKIFSFFYKSKENKAAETNYKKWDAGQQGLEMRNLAQGVDRETGKIQDAVYVKHFDTLLKTLKGQASLGHIDGATPEQKKRLEEIREDFPKLGRGEKEKIDTFIDGFYEDEIRNYTALIDRIDAILNRQ